VTLRPRFLWRRAALRFRARRETVWVSGETWVLRDRAEFPNGYVEERRRLCELVAPDRVRVTADDLPEGAEVLLEEDGFRIVPYPIEQPIGPLRWPMRARDRYRVEPDGTLVEEIDLRTLGVPVARVTFRVRPVERGAAELSARGTRAAASR
jgi:hypothetical protein